MQQENQNFDKYFENASQYIVNQNQLQIQTLGKMNEIAQVHYSKNLEKIQKIKEETTQTNILTNQIREFFDKIDKVGNNIDGLDSSVDYLSQVLDRIEQKLDELEKQ